jgi:subtilisin-like proprotein convertase family protein
MLCCGLLAGPAAAATYSLTYSGGPLTIAEDGEFHYAKITDSNLGTITDVNVMVDIDHYWPEDLDIYLAHSLTGEEGTWKYVQLYNQEQGGAIDENLNVLFDDQATTSITDAVPPYGLGSYQPTSNPEEISSGVYERNLLTDYNGDMAAGIWSLVLFDNAYGDIGTLQSFRVDLETAATPTNAVPLPGAVVLLGSGLGALVGVRRRSGRK